jgi:hypothetical protein
MRRTVRRRVRDGCSEQVFQIFLYSCIPAQTQAARNISLQAGKPHGIGSCCGGEYKIFAPTPCGGREYGIME